VLKIAIAIVLGGLVYRLVLLIGGRFSRGRSQSESQSHGASNSDAGKIVDADFEEIKE
jgi:hypothetical protein